MNVFVEVLNKKLWENLCFCNKTKTVAYLENRRHAFVDIEKNFSKPNFRQISFDERLKGY